jgi:hypothetical protein
MSAINSHDPGKPLDDSAPVVVISRYDCCVTIRCDPDTYLISCELTLVPAKGQTAKNGGSTFKNEALEKSKQTFVSEAFIA